MTGRILLLLGALSIAAPTQDRPTLLGEIDFFGYSGIDVASIRAVLPIREGANFGRTDKGISAAIEAVKKSVTLTTGSAPTDVSVGCCDEKGRWMIYIGLRGRSWRTFEYNPAPRGNLRLPGSATKLYEEMEARLILAVQSNPAEDDSQGYALSAEPHLRTTQLTMRHYATHNAVLLLQVLKSSADAKQRAVAAELLGYAQRSEEQINALVVASRDSDATVRNNAVRALGVLARSKMKLPKQIPASSFIAMLHSGLWVDRNKSAMLLEQLTENRDSKLLAELREQSVDALLEMARWRSLGHSWTAKMILGRIGGIEEEKLAAMVEKGELQPIFDRFEKQ